MRKILKLCLLASITSTSGYIDVMATTLVGDVQGFKIEAGASDAAPGAVAEVAAGKTVENWKDDTDKWKDVTGSTYSFGEAIDVMAGSCTNPGNGKIQAGALTGIISAVGDGNGKLPGDTGWTPTYSESAGTVAGYVVRHHNGDGLEWKTTDQSAPYTYTIKSDPFSMHGFISDSLTLTDAKGEEDPGNKFYEAIDSDNKLYRLYRDVVPSAKKIASGDTAKLSVAVSKTSMVPTADVSIGGATLNHYGYDGKKIGKVIYVNSSAVKSIDPQADFIIDLSKDSEVIATGTVSQSYDIKTNVVNDTTNAIDTLTVLTGQTVDAPAQPVSLAFTGANNLKKGDDYIPLNIGNASTKGIVTFGGTRTTGDTTTQGANTAMNGIGNVTVTNDNSVLTLKKGADAELTTAGNWKFIGESKLIAGIPMVIAAGTTCSFGASVPTGQS